MVPCAEVFARAWSHHRSTNHRAIDPCAGVHESPTHGRQTQNVKALEKIRPLICNSVNRHQGIERNQVSVWS